MYTSDNYTYQLFVYMYLLFNNNLFLVICNLLFTPQLAGKARQLGCPKIVLDHVRVYYIYIYNVCMLWISSLLVVYDAIDNASLSRATRTSNDSIGLDGN